MALARIIFAPAIVLLAAVTACGSKDSGPTSPSPTSPGATLPELPGVARVITAEVRDFKHTVTIGWDAAARATEYELSGSRTPVGSERVDFNARTAATTFILAEPGEYTIFLHAKNEAGTRSDPGRASFLVLDMQDATAGLFFSSGPMAELGVPALEQARGWPRGSTVPVNVQNDVSDSSYQAINRVAQDLQAATGSYQISVQRTARTDLTPLNQEVYIIRPDTEEQRLSFCPDTQGRRIAGCPTVFTSRDGVIYLRALVTVDDTEYIAAHEFAHVWGLFHIRLPRAPSGVPIPLMVSPAFGFSDRLTSLELELIRTVYSNGFGPGTPIRDFIARGLIKG